MNPNREEPDDCSTCILCDAALCPAATSGSAALAGGTVDHVTVESGDTLFNMHDRVAHVHCVRLGVVKLVRYDVGGNQRIVRILTIGDLAALESVFERDQQHTAIAVTRAVLCRVPALQFRQRADANPVIRQHLLDKSRAALRDADYWLSELVSNTVPARVRLARLLLQLRIGNTDQIHRLRLADYGGILGIAPETACRILNELMVDGVLAKAGRNSDGRLFRAEIVALSQLSGEEVAVAAPVTAD